MKHFWLSSLLALLATLLPLAAAHAAPAKLRLAALSEKQGVAPLAPGNALAGRAKADDARCQECHGKDGNANEHEDGIGNIGKYPKLAGQLPAYIIKQIHNFRSGERNHETMAVMANSVSDAELVDIAAFFASQTRSPGDGSSANALGQRLFSQGDAGRGIPPCASCHGADGKGGVAGATIYPAIASQYRRYLVKQLSEWQAGVRANSPGRLMNSFTKALSDTEIDALADYISGL